jgi:hypothetical protein
MEKPEDTGPASASKPAGNDRPVDEVARAVRGGVAGPDNTAPAGQGEQPDQAARQNLGRERLVPQDGPPAQAVDRANIAGDKDFELGPPAG